jgi:hypothetical protein
MNGTGTLTTAGKTFGALTVDGVGITVTLGDALNISFRFLTITRGTFTTNNFNVTGGGISSSNSNTRTINLGSSTVTLSSTGPIGFFTSTNLTLNAGTSQITCVATQFDGGGMTFHNVTNTGNTFSQIVWNGANTFNNLTLTPSASVGVNNYSFSANQTINGTLTSAGGSAIRRTFLNSNTIGTVRTLTVATLSADDCDFRDITLAGAAAGAAPTRAGNCGGNSGITFPAAKTVYRVGTGPDWMSSNSWALTSGGTGDNANFPLPQDTAVIDNSATPTGGTIGFGPFNNPGAIDCSARTNALSLSASSLTIYGSLTLSSAATISASLQFLGRGVMTVTTAGNSLINAFVTVNAVTGTLRLLDAFTISGGGGFINFTLTSGTLDLNNFTLTTPSGTSSGFVSNSTNTRTLAFGTGNITITCTNGNIWDTGNATNMTVTGTPVVNVISSGTNPLTINSGNPSEANTISFNFTAGTYTLNLSNAVAVRNLNFTGFAGSWTVGNQSIFGNLTISTGMTLPATTNTLTFASTNATARTITSNGKTFDFPVTFNGLGGTFRLLDNLTVGPTRTTTLTAGTLDFNGFTLSTGLFSSSNSNARTLAFGSSSMSVTSTSTGTVWNVATATNFTVTGTPVVNVTNNTSNAITVSPGSPTEANSINFNFTAGTYSLTLDAGNVRNLNFTGFAGTLNNTARTIFGDCTISTGMTLTAGANALTFASTSGTVRNIASNGRTLDFPITFAGVGGSWQLQDALNMSARTLTVTSGTLTTNGFTVTAGTLSSNNSNVRVINLGASTVNLSTAGTALDFATSTNLTFSAGTSQINITSGVASFVGGGQTFNNVSFTNNTTGTRAISGANVFNNLTLRTNATGLSIYSFAANQAINSTLTCDLGGPRQRGFLRSDAIGTVRTLTAATLNAPDCDWRDITIAGGAAGTSPTRAGDCGGNTGITFPAAKTVYRVGTNTDWGGSNSWAPTSNGTGDDTNFPLAQDTAVIDNGTALTGTLLISEYNISAVDASTRTDAITLNHAAVTRYGAYALGSGITLSGTAGQTFSGRGTMDLTSAGKTLPFVITVDTPSGTFRLLDATTISTSCTLTRGTLNLNNFTLTCTTFNNNNANVRTLAFGTGNITVTSTGTVWNSSTITNFTVTGTPVVNVTNSTATATTVNAGAVTEANSISFNFTAGTYAATVNGFVRSLNFTGFAGTLNNAVRSIFGDLTVSTGMTLTAGINAQTFASTSGTPRTIRTNGKTFDFPLIFDGAGGTFRLLDALTMGSTRALTHTNGTVDLNGLTLTVGSSYATGVGTKNLTFNGGTLTCPSAGTLAFNNAQPANFTTTAGTGIGTINMTAATAKTFVGGDATYNCTLNNGGAGALTITGSNTFTTLQNSVQPTTFLFTAGTTTTLSNWEIDGTPGNLVTVDSATAASHTLFKQTGTVSADYLSLSRSVATGAAGWYAGVNSTDGGNNTGWIFTAPPLPSLSSGNFFLIMGGW